MAIDGDSPTWEVTDASGERPTVKGTAKECNGRYRGSHPAPEIVFWNGNRMEFNSPTFHQRRYKGILYNTPKDVGKVR